MAHTAFPDGLPDIRGLFAFRSETAKALYELTHTFPHAPGTLAPAHQPDDKDQLVFVVKRDFEHGQTFAKQHTVLIAAAFRGYNRYADGPGTRAPQGPAAYRDGYSGAASTIDPNFEPAGDRAGLKRIEYAIGFDS
jgi:hypothetical protein